MVCCLLSNVRAATSFYQNSASHVSFYQFAKLKLIIPYHFLLGAFCTVRPRLCRQYKKPQPQTIMRYLRLGQHSNRLYSLFLYLLFGNHNNCMKRFASLFIILLNVSAIFSYDTPYTHKPYTMLPSFLFPRDEAHP